MIYTDIIDDLKSDNISTAAKYYLKQMSEVFANDNTASEIQSNFSVHFCIVYNSKTV